MKNTIILPIDVFNPSEELLRYGIYTAKNLGEKLLLFNAHFETVKDHVLPGSTAIKYVEDTKSAEEAKRRLESIYETISEEWHATKMKIVTDSIPNWQGHKESYLLDEIEDDAPTMIIIAIKNDFNLINELLGTPETKLAEEADCPVLLLPEGTKYQEITTINYLLERYKPITEVIEELSFLIYLTSNYDISPAISLIYYFGDNKESAEKELAFKKSIILSELTYDKFVFENYSDKDVDTVIHENIKKSATGIFAFPSRDKSFIERLTSNDNTKRLILKSSIPVLVF